MTIQGAFPHLVLFAFATGAGSMGCGWLVGVDEFHAAQDGGRSTSEDAGGRDSGDIDARPSLALSKPECGALPFWSQSCADCASADVATCAGMAACVGMRCGEWHSCLAECGAFSNPRPPCLVECSGRVGTFSFDNFHPDWLGGLVGSGCAYGVCGVGQFWECVGNFGWPPATQRPSIRIRGTLATGTPSAGKVCRYDDELCDEPVVGPLEPSADGYVEFVVPTAQVAEGRPYVELLAPDTPTVLYYPGHPFFVDQQFTVKGIQKTADGEQRFAQLGVTVDQAKGTVLVGPLYDCTSGHAGGLTVAVTGGERTFYSAGFQIDPEAEATSNTVSFAIVPNVKPGLVTISATHPAHGKVARATVFVRAGAVTVAEMWPAAVTEY